VCVCVHTVNCIVCVRLRVCVCVCTHVRLIASEHVLNVVWCIHELVFVQKRARQTKHISIRG